MNNKQPVQTGEGRGDSPKVIMLPPFLYLDMLLIGLGLHWLWPLRVLPENPARVAGGVLVLIGFAVGTWGGRAMLRAGTNINPHKPAVTIIDDGPFRFSRNPLYVALTADYIGLALLADSIWPFFLLVPLLVLMHGGVVRREERYLEEKFGDTYLAYKARVRRWL